MTYKEKLLDVRWQKKRLEVLNRDKWTCQECHATSGTMHVHHLDYESNTEPWDYPDYYLQTLCSGCHKETEDDKGEFENNILKIIRLGLKDSFERSCFSSTINHYNIGRLFYLLWELDSSVVMDFLERTAMENKIETAKKFSIETGSPLNTCFACGGKMKFFENYNASKCDTCGFSISYPDNPELLKNPIENGEQIS